MSISPRSSRELSKLMADDPRLRKRLEELIADTDRRIEQEIMGLMQRFLQESDVELALMSHDDVSKGIKTFYREAKLDGQYVKLW